MLRRVGRALARGIARVHRDRVPFLASALAFDSLMAALPLALLLLGAAGYVFHAFRGADPGNLHLLFDRFFPPRLTGRQDPFAAFEGIAVTLAENRALLSSWGAPLFLLFASRFYGSVSQALALVWGSEGARPFFWAMAVDVWLVLVTAVLFAGNALLSAQTVVTGWLGDVLGLVSALGFSVLLFYMVYTVSTDRRIPVDAAVVAAVVTSIGFEAAKGGFAFYVRSFTTLDQLGSSSNVVAILLFLVWLYLVALIFLIGAEVGHAYERATRRETPATER
jgi:membrane protein